MDESHRDIIASGANGAAVAYAPGGIAHPVARHRIPTAKSRMSAQQTALPAVNELATDNQNKSRRMANSIQINFN
ncbi:hypothetical protein [Burkholderia sp. BCC1644]|uniref:hypothetical protein n=1 Tax=Burkholderia sp. BCC1644 TaxID=2676293 RepID=UPI0015925FC6|nr:hypothetical protein [Burkholderia sp. BCC1644]